MELPSDPKALAAINGLDHPPKEDEFIVASTEEDDDQPLGYRQCKALARGGRAYDEPWDRCKGAAMVGSNVCMKHGGRPYARIKTGKFSKAMGPLRKAYQEALGDPSLLSMRDVTAALHAIVERQMQRAQDLDTPEFRKHVLDLMEQIQFAVAADDTESFRKLMTELRALVKRGVDEDSALRTMTNGLHRLAERLEAHWKIKLAKQHAINETDFKAMLKQMIDIVFEEAGADLGAKVLGRVDRLIVQARNLN